MSPSVLFWRCTGVEGLERPEIEVGPDGVAATATLVCVEGGGYRLDHRWRLDGGWRALAGTVERWDARGHGLLYLELAGMGWRVDGALRPDLDGAEEPDLSVTPVCDSVPIRRTPEGAGASLALDVACIDGPVLTVARSGRRYDRRGPGRVRVVGLGPSRGFEADLVVDEVGLVRGHEHLFERVAPPA